MKKYINLLKKVVFRETNNQQEQPSQKPAPILFKVDNCSESIPQASHKGNIGDVVIACVFLKSYWQQTGRPIKLHLQTDVPAHYIFDHPLKDIYLNKQMAEQLVPVLLAQPYIAEVTIGSHLPKKVNLPLDAFRSLPIDLRCSLVQGWYQLCSDIWLNVYEPWITAKKLPEYQNTIVMSRTARLRSDYIDYKFLSRFSDNLLFLGLPEECNRFREETGIDCQYLTVESFDLMINIINSCRLFVGNQGFAYTLAESVKCPRVLESNSFSPNNYPMSANGRIAIFQEQFEKFVYAMAL